MTEVTVDRLGHKGDGIAKGPIFIKGVLPGEVVSGELVGDVLQSPKIIRPSESRVKAPCSHAKACGGCALQHASDDFVESWKVDQVATALNNQTVPWELRKVSTSPKMSRRRAVFHGRRTKQGTLVGFKMRASDNLIGVPNCMLMTPAIAQAFPLFEELVVLAASRRSEVDIAVIDLGYGLDISVLNAVELSPSIQEKIGNLLRDWGLIRVSWNQEVVAQSQPARLGIEGALVEIPPGTFLQATLEGQSALIQAMREAALGAKSVVDLFSGCGTFSLPLASQSEVHAVEGQRDMLDALLDGWKKSRGLKGLTVEKRDLFRRPLMDDELERFDAVVIDPPRAGAEAQCIEIARSDCSLIGFVSCNPVTFARDAKILVDAGFRISWVDVVDQFRWSTHVEIAAKFVRD